MEAPKQRDAQRDARCMDGGLVFFFLDPGLVIVDIESAHRPAWHILLQRTLSEALIS